MIWNDLDSIQNILLPINNNRNVFIFPTSLKNNLPNEVIAVIKHSQKFVPLFHICSLIKLNL